MGDSLASGAVLAQLANVLRCGSYLCTAHMCRDMLVLREDSVR